MRLKFINYIKSNMPDTEAASFSPIIFDLSILHSTIHEGIKERLAEEELTLYSAGQLFIHKSKIKAFGESSSIGIQSKAIDTDVIRRFLQNL